MVKVYRLKNLGDKKGTVFNLDIDKGIVEIPVFYRKKGTHPPGHFHKGTDLSTDPQKVIILEGKVKFFLTYPNSKKEETICTKGEVIEIPKKVFHEYEVLENAIFAEVRLQKYDKDNIDNYSYEEFGI